MSDLSRDWTIEEFKAGDGYVSKYRRYAALGEAKAEVVFLHGIQSHSGWYEFSCGELSRQGFAVSFFERRGSGMNDEARGDCPGFRRLLDDIAEFLVTIPRAVSRAAGVVRVPVFLAGISWGGKLAIALERRHPGLVDGLILLCPGFFPRVSPSLGQRLRILAARLFRPRKMFPIPLNDPELFTANPRWHEFLKTDSRALHEATARFLLESVRLDGYLRFAPKYVHVPVLTLLAEQDRIIRNAETRVFVDRFATPDRQIIEYPAAHHTLEFEPDPMVFLRDLVGWIERHITPEP